MDDQSPKKVKPIDIRKVFQEKNPKLAQLIPGFIYNYITRIMHIHDVNEILENYGELQGIEFVHQIVNHFDVKERVIGIENVPTEGRFIFAANHPLGGFDGLLLMSNVNKLLGEVRFLVNDILMNIPQLEGVFVPINKQGGHGRDIAKIVHEQYHSDAQILIFPSGYASRKIKGQITDMEWKKHFIQKAIQYQRDIIPVHVSGRNSNFFYRLANLRKWLRLKWNLEQFFLPDETFRHRGQKFTISFGKPIPWTSFDKGKKHKEWAKVVRDHVYSMAESHKH
ncbi:1-acyl-sn-glycerol-3-phosphate acyltransferase [Sunxiuqinia sp. sy24]|uniref:1-acyl-sn-glycerol-3-phosphate acyltransferase n=1 Tax=Sunxiuqinia sp. sy24 TaxID=3461495 RepID=UPI0040455D83